MVRKLSGPHRFYRLTLGASLFLFWLLLSGQYDILHIVLGIASSLIIVWVAERLQVLDWEGHPTHLGLRVFPYWFWLSGKVMQANFHVVWLILKDLFQRNGSELTPVEGRLSAHQKSHLGKTTYANSITLTPGTLTLSIEENNIKVHALTHEALEELRQGEMDKRVTQFEGLS